MEDEKMKSNREIPIDARLIAINQTEFYAIEEQDRPFIRAIRAVYLYDRNEVTHLCEFTPSYYLIHLYDEVVLTDAGAALDDFQKDEIYQRYENEPSDNTYMHCADVDQMARSGRRFTHRKHGRTGVKLSDVPREEQMESLREHYCGNHAL
jgi:hypothetical protein